MSSLTINSNMAAQSTTRYLSISNSRLQKSVERLSSGYKVNTAADGPASLVISEKLRNQVSGLGQAVQNAGDAVNMVKTAEGALTQVHTLLNSMRDLAVHAANAGANDTASVEADQQQIANAIDSINKIAQETQFGNKKLLDGSAGIKATVSGDDVTSGNFSQATNLADGDVVSVNVVSAATKAAVYTVDFGADTDMVTDAVGSFSFTINSVQVSYTSATSVTALRLAINNVSDETGVEATITTAGQLDLVSTEYGSAANVTIAGATGLLAAGAATATDDGTDAAANVTVGGAALTDAMWTSGDGMVLKDSLGNEIALTATAATTTGDKGAQFNVAVGTLVFQIGAYSGQTREVNIGDVHSYNLGTTVESGKNVSTIDVTTAAGAQQALDILDQAIADVSGIRADLGAMQTNVLESSINSLTIAQENISASRSTIIDTDMASEMVQFTQFSVLQQAGVAMLSQANQQPQQILSLLR